MFARADFVSSVVRPRRHRSHGMPTSARMHPWIDFPRCTLPATMFAQTLSCARVDIFLSHGVYFLDCSAYLLWVEILLKMGRVGLAMKSPTV